VLVQEIVQAPELEAVAIAPATAIESLRDSLRTGLVTEETSALMREILVDALSASRNISTNCPSCHHRHDVLLPDLNTRVTAVTKLLEQLEGRISEVQTVEERREERGAAALLKGAGDLSTHDLALAIFRMTEGDAIGDVEAAATAMEKVVARISRLKDEAFKAYGPSQTVWALSSLLDYVTERFGPGAAQTATS
jgi:hypothetical protein